MQTKFKVYRSDLFNVKKILAPVHVYTRVVILIKQN